MTSLEVANLLFETSKALSPRGAHLHLDTAAWVRTWTPHQNQMADAAARIFAREKQWPPVCEEVACQLYFRCLFAIDACINSQGRHAQGKPRRASDQELLEALLIDAWHLEGLDWAERRYRTRRSEVCRACA